MADYIVPRVLVQQEFTQLPVFSEFPLAACIIGPQYKLIRYSESSEKALAVAVNPDATNGNTYMPSANVVYPYPNVASNSVVDQDYVKVFVDKAVAKYFPQADLNTGLFTNTATRVSDNKIITGSLSSWVSTTAIVLKTANGYDRTAAELGGRDVKVGDVIKVTLANGTSPQVTKVKKLHATTDDAVVGTEIANTSNAVAGAAVQTLVYVPAPGSDPQSTVITDTTYVGYLSKGITADVYTITVTTAGNASAVRFSIASANGAFTTKTGQTLTSLKLVVDNAGSNNLSLTFDGAPDNWTTSQSWTLTVRVLVAATNASSSACTLVTATGTYTGTKDLSYIVKVIRGGVFSTGSNPTVCAKVSVTSTDTDSSADVNVAAATNFNVGTKGVVAQIAEVASGGLVLGDVYYIPVTAAGPGRVNIIELQDSLSATLNAATSNEALKFELSLVKDIELPKNRSVEDETLNWETTASGVTVKSGAATSDPLITLDSVAVDLPLSDGDVYIQHRDLLLDSTVAIASVTSTSDVAAALGKIHPDNLLAQAVYDAVLNSAGVPVHYIGVASNDLAGYNAALEPVKRSSLPYSLVPLTQARDVQDAIISHITAMSVDSVGKWRITWLSTPVVESALLYNLQEDNDNYVAYTSGNASTVVVADAKFITDGVRSTDTVLIDFITNPDGTVSSDEYAISEVVSETTLILTPALPATIPSGSPVKVQVKRYYTKDEQIDNLAEVGSDFDSRRVRAVFPDVAKLGSVTKSGLFLAAALAGLRSGVVPHQGLTNTQLLGFDTLTKSVTTYSEEQLNRLASAGYWIVTQSKLGATPYTRHQLTTDSSNLNMSEDSITTNVDSLSYAIKKVLDPFIGTYNINSLTLKAIESSLRKALDSRLTNTSTTRAGAQLLSYEIKKLEQNATFKDKVDIEVLLTLPYPVNYITLKFTV